MCVRWDAHERRQALHTAVLAHTEELRLPLAGTLHTGMHGSQHEPPLLRFERAGVHHMLSQSDRTRIRGLPVDQRGATLILRWAMLEARCEWAALYQITHGHVFCRCETRIVADHGRQPTDTASLHYSVAPTVDHAFRTGAPATSKDVPHSLRQSLFEVRPSAVDSGSALAVPVIVGHQPAGCIVLRSSSLHWRWAAQIAEELE